MRAHINVEDGENGSLNVQAVYVGGFTVDSPAHVNVALLMKHADTLGERIEAPQGLGEDMLPRTAGELPEGDVEVLSEHPI